MIEVSAIIRGILYNLGEFYSKSHSDPELIEAINSVLRVVNIILINRESSWVLKNTKLRVKNGKASLPEDFVKIKVLYAKDGDGDEINYSGDYKIVKNSIYVDDTATSTDYYFTIEEVQTTEDEIDLPPIYLQLFIRYATGLLNNTFGSESLDKLLSQEIDSLADSANTPAIERPMEFFC